VAAKCGLAAPEVGEALARARQLFCEELSQPTQLGLIQHGQWFHKITNNASKFLRLINWYKVSTLGNHM
jgi:hypothetical protein